MKYLIILICFAVAGMALATDSDVSPHPGTPGATDSELTQLDYFDLEALGASTRCVGIGFDGTNFWATDGVEASGSGTNTIWVVSGDAAHTLVTSFEQVETSGWGLRDLCWDGTYMYGSQSYQVDYYDATYTKVGSYTCNACTPNRAQAYDGTYFYTGDFDIDIFQVSWDGVSGSTASYTAWSNAIENSGTYGAAWDYANNCLWVTTATNPGDGKLYQIDDTGAFIATYNLSPESATSGGCTMGNYVTDAEQLWVLAQASPDGVYCWDISTVSFESRTWGAIKTIF